MAWPLIRLLPREFHFNFVKLAPVAAVLSAVLIVGSVGSFAFRGLNLGIDFAGGVEMEVTAPAGVNQAQLRAAVQSLGAADANVNTSSGGNKYIVRFKPESGQEATMTPKVKDGLTAKFPGLAVANATTVGAKVSGELFRSGFEALALAMALMLAYIWFRFQLQFGLGAVVAVVHDVVLTLGLLSVIGIEFSMTSIAALLTVIGYSMNEKVITFDRLRENLRKYKTLPLADVINKSENERLSRTLITGASAILALAGALFFGGPVLFPLVFTMVFGIVIGTYSSIYVALPIILLWGVRRGDDDEPAKPIKLGPASRAG